MWSTKTLLKSIKERTLPPNSSSVFITVKWALELARFHFGSILTDVGGYAHVGGNRSEE